MDIGISIKVNDGRQARSAKQYYLDTAKASEISISVAGWQDVDLADQGAWEVIAGGKLLKEEGYTFDVPFT